MGDKFVAKVNRGLGINGKIGKISVSFAIILSKNVLPLQQY